MTAKKDSLVSFHANGRSTSSNSSSRLLLHELFFGTDKEFTKLCCRRRVVLILVLIIMVTTYGWVHTFPHKYHPKCRLKKIKRVVVALERSGWMENKTFVTDFLFRVHQHAAKECPETWTTNVSSFLQHSCVLILNR